MGKYILSRVFEATVALLVLISVSFFLVHLAPGSPFDQEVASAPSVQARLESRYHLDQPLLTQYWLYLQQLAHFDFGPSFQYLDWSVQDILREGYPITLRVGLSSLVLVISTSMALALWVAYHQRLLPYLLLYTAIATTIPSFVLGPLLVFCFATCLHWLPAGGTGSLPHLVLPVVALSIPQVAVLTRLLASSFQDVLAQPYVTTAYAKGLSRWQTLIRHALKPSLLPLVLYVAPLTTHLLTGSVIIEQIFGLNGIGRHFVQGALNRDYSLVMAVIILSGTLMISLSLFADLLYAWLYPQTRTEEFR